MCIASYGAQPSEIGWLRHCESLGKKLTLAPATQLLNWDIVYDLCDRA